MYIWVPQTVLLKMPRPKQVFNKIMDSGLLKFKCRKKNAEEIVTVTPTGEVV